LGYGESVTRALRLGTEIMAGAAAEVLLEAVPLIRVEVKTFVFLLDPTASLTSSSSLSSSGIGTYSS